MQGVCRLQSIQAFCDLGQATSLPLSTYSSSGSSFTKLICPIPGYSASY
jgi:ABC-type polysaccharide/polyol phosphate transport system ATPase subunit